MKIEQLASKQNLELAWRRITSGGNQQYKRFFRHLYYAYEVALDDNLRDLRQRLIGSTYTATPSERIYLPKNSGLHRPISLLHIEDQIVLQAFANLAAKKIYSKRQPLQFNVIFSNILESKTSTFFFRRWQETYAAFREKIEQHYKKGMRWVADFDLAAFYDTISHQLLIKTIYPRTTNPDLDWFMQCLSTWSSGKESSSHGHGLPQGPLASDFLAECFLLPIDQALQNTVGYSRYVDDIRLLGNSENEVRSAVIKLERICQESGLIPQSGKFTIKKAHSVHDAVAILPSIADPHHETGKERLSQSKARQLFRKAVGGRPYRVKEKSRLRYVLFRAEPDAVLLNLAIKLIPHHPEHSDAFFHHLSRYGHRKPIYRLCLELIEKSPYPYVRGEAWHLLANYLKMKPDFELGTTRILVKKAIELAKIRTGRYLMETWGACHFLSVVDEIGIGKYCRFLNHQSPLTQSFLAPVLPDRAFMRGETAEKYLLRSAFEPGLSICSRIHGLGLTLHSLGITKRQLPSQVTNTLFQLGVIRARGSRIDPIAETLKSRYGTISVKSWHDFFGNEYVHALGLLKQAEATFNSGPSFWLSCMNSFNQTMFLSLQAYLLKLGHPGVVRAINRNGELIDFGVTLDSNNSFSKHYPDIADCFRTINKRRNLLPHSHPYEKKTVQQGQYLKSQERNEYVSKLRDTYLAIAALALRT